MIICHDYVCLLQPKDGADDLLFAEKHTLSNIKKSMESQLKLVQQHLQVRIDEHMFKSLKMLIV